MSLRDSFHFELKEFFLPDELIEHILSYLPVKSLLRLRCLSKWCNDLIISDTFFIETHMKRSSTRNPHLLLWRLHHSRDGDCFHRGELCSIPLLLKNKTSPIFLKKPFKINEVRKLWLFAGSCNGLICLIQPCSELLCLWNPATNRRSDRISNLQHDKYCFTLGYDKSAETYKIVAYRFQLTFINNEKSIINSEVKVFTFGDNNVSWRTIECFPVLPLYWNTYLNNRNNGVYLNNSTLNWLAIHSVTADITVRQYVILSLDLSNETYSQLRLPTGFKEIPKSLILWQDDQLTIGVLLDCLCFSHDLKRSYFVIWQLKEFQVEDSWVQLYNISYLDLYSLDHEFNSQWWKLFPLYSSMNGNMLILANASEDENDAFMYNCIDNSVEQIRHGDRISWFATKYYFESLVSTD